MHGKFITATIGAAGLGALWGWAITGDIMERRLWEKEAYLLAMRAMYLEVKNDYDELTLLQDAEAIPEGEILPAEETSEEDVTAEVAEEAESSDEDEEPVDEEAYEEQRKNLRALIDRYTAEGSEDGRGLEQLVRRDREVQGAKQRPPYVIPKSEYAWGEESDDYAKITVTWFPKYRILVDEDDEVIDDVRNVIGYENLNKFGQDSDSPDVVFVRNQRLMIDYEVVYDDENDPPLHVRYGMDKMTFETRKAAGTLRLRDEDLDRS